MTESLPVTSYVILILVNTVILVPAIFSMGMLYQHSTEVDKSMLQLDAFKRNRFEIYRYVTLNCSQLLIEYPEFILFVQMDLCKTYNVSLILGKLSLFLSTLFNTYLPYGLYGPPVLPIIVTGFTTGVLFYTNFTDDQWRISIIESISILGGYSIIVGHLLLPNFDRYLRMIYSTIVRRFSMWFSRNANEHIYDNIRNDEDTHGD